MKSDKDQRKEILKKLASGQITQEEAVQQLLGSTSDISVVWLESDDQTYRLGNIRHLEEEELRALIAPKQPLIIKVIDTGYSIATSEKEIEL